MVFLANFANWNALKTPVEELGFASGTTPPPDRSQ